MNRLKGQIFYLAGPMDRVEGRGVEWREDMQNFVWNELEGGIFNPCSKPIDWGLEDEDSRVWRRESLQKAAAMERRGLTHDANKIYEAIHEQMRDIVASDLRGVDTSHAVILHIDCDVHMCGSYGEQTHACLQRKPVVVHCKQGKANVPDWLWGICQHEMFFSTWDEVKDFLKHVAFDDNVDHFKRWRFIDMFKIYGFDRYQTYQGDTFSDKTYTNPGSTAPSNDNSPAGTLIW